MQIRGIRPNASPRIDELDISKLPEFEISKDPNEWQYVERLLTSGKIVPEPKKFDKKAPSGWIPQKGESFIDKYIECQSADKDC